MSAPDGSPVGAERSIGQLFASATTEMSALVHDEIALAKAQLKQDVKRGATSGGAFSVAAAILLFSLPMLNFALAYGIRPGATGTSRSASCCRSRRTCWSQSSSR